MADVKDSRGRKPRRPRGDQRKKTVGRSLTARPSWRIEQCVTSADIDRIVKAVGIRLPSGAARPSVPLESGASKDHWGSRSAALRARLDSAVKLWRFEQSLERLPTPHEVSDAFAKIDRHATALLQILDPDGQRHLHAVFLELSRRARREGTRGMARRNAHADDATFDEKWIVAGTEAAASLADVVPRLRDLRRWSQMPTAQRFGITSGRIRAGEGPLDNLLGRLALAWKEIWEQRPTLTFDPIEGEVVGGPFLSFLRAVVDPLLGPSAPSDDAIRQRIGSLPGRSPRRRTPKVESE